MLRVGLTGGIGSGKSTVAQRLSEHGATVIDADQLAREVVAPGSEGLAAIAARFGDDVLDDAGALNRPALGALVFADAQARQRPRGDHPPPHRAAHRGARRRGAPDAVVVHDVPLLVEKAMGPAYHLVVVVGAEQELRVKRLMHTRGMTEADARSRIASQATDEQRRAAADVWLANDGHKDDLLAAVDTLWHERLVPFEDNVRHGRRSHRPEALELVPSDPAWAAQAERLLARLRLAFGDVLVTADHVGQHRRPRAARQGRHRPAGRGQEPRRRGRRGGPGAAGRGRLPPGRRRVRRLRPWLGGHVAQAHARQRRPGARRAHPRARGGEPGVAAGR